MGAPTRRSGCGPRPGCKRPRSSLGNAWLRPVRDRCLPMGTNKLWELWAYHFVYDACANAQQIKCLTVVDEYTLECLAIEVAGSIRSRRVIEVLSRLISERSPPPSQPTF